MKKILITGMPSSGKSTVSANLKSLGYISHDIEEIKGLFRMVDKDTGKKIRRYDNDDIEKVKQAEWICNEKKLQKLLDKQETETAFYCGTASNIFDIIRLFDLTIALIISGDETKRRLSTRKSGSFGNTEKAQEWVLSWQDWWENKMKEAGAIFINGEKEPKIVAEEVLNKI